MPNYTTDVVLTDSGSGGGSASIVDIEAGTGTNAISGDKIKSRVHFSNTTDDFNVLCGTVSATWEYADWNTLIDSKGNLSVKCTLDTVSGKALGIDLGTAWTYDTTPGTSVNLYAIGVLSIWRVKDAIAIEFLSNNTGNDYDYKGFSNVIANGVLVSTNLPTPILKSATAPNVVMKADIVDGLTSTDIDKPLSAKQGKVLSEGKADRLEVKVIPTTANIPLTPTLLTSVGITNSPMQGIDWETLVNAKGHYFTVDLVANPTLITLFALPTGSGSLYSSTLNLEIDVVGNSVTLMFNGVNNGVNYVYYSIFTSLTALTDFPSGNFGSGYKDWNKVANIPNAISHTLGNFATKLGAVTPAGATYSINEILSAFKDNEYGMYDFSPTTTPTAFTNQLGLPKNYVRQSVGSGLIGVYKTGNILRMTYQCDYSVADNTIRYVGYELVANTATGTTTLSNSMWESLGNPSYYIQRKFAQQGTDISNVNTDIGSSILNNATNVALTAADTTTSLSTTPAPTKSWSAQNVIDFCNYYGWGSYSFNVAQYGVACFTINSVNTNLFGSGKVFGSLPTSGIVTFTLTGGGTDIRLLIEVIFQPNAIGNNFTNPSNHKQFRMTYIASPSNAANLNKNITWADFYIEQNPQLLSLNNQSEFWSKINTNAVASGSAATVGQFIKVLLGDPVSGLLRAGIGLGKHYIDFTSTSGYPASLATKLQFFAIPTTLITDATTYNCYPKGEIDISLSDTHIHIKYLAYTDTTSTPAVRRYIGFECCVSTAQTFANAIWKPILNPDLNFSIQITTLLNGWSGNVTLYETFGGVYIVFHVASANSATSDNVVDLTSLINFNVTNFRPMIALNRFGNALPVQPTAVIGVGTNKILTASFRAGGGTFDCFIGR